MVKYTFSNFFVTVWTKIADTDNSAGSTLANNNVNTVSLARTYWGIPSSSFEIGGNTTLPCQLQIGIQYGPSAYGRRSILPNLQPPGFRMVLPPISQDPDGIPQ